ncbi:hypothetical protein EVAR_5801_1 [Eumeta japonica]|uniref:Uncharacterized protein n=1 Tax=Eumeta variegata TaxID=151549 RepID=A0A4C1T580_EUMVA|nr:hypothetical protein EVAR_5801_1 [Eumeta japonica]
METSSNDNRGQTKNIDVENESSRRLIEESANGEAVEAIADNEVEDEPNGTGQCTEKRGFTYRAIYIISGNNSGDSNTPPHLGLTHISMFAFYTNIE